MKLITNRLKWFIISISILIVCSLIGVILFQHAYREKVIFCTEIMSTSSRITQIHLGLKHEIQYGMITESRAGTENVLMKMRESSRLLSSVRKHLPWVNINPDIDRLLLSMKQQVSSSITDLQTYLETNELKDTVTSVTLDNLSLMNQSIATTEVAKKTLRTEAILFFQIECFMILAIVCLFLYALSLYYRNYRIHITDQKKLQKMLNHEKELKVELEQINQELENFTSIASHDLRAPLRRIMKFSEFMIEDFGADMPQKQRDYINTITQTTTRMSTLIHDLMRYVSVTAEQYNYERVDLNTILKDITDDLEVEIEEAGATVTVCNLPSIEGVPSQVRQIFQNIIGNCIRYRRKEVPLVVSLSCKVYGDEGMIRDMDKNMCRIIINDNGMGFDSKFNHHIFQPFKRLVSNDVIEGSGIGLSVVKRIIDRYGGWVKANGKLGIGCTFTMQLPLHQHPGPETSKILLSHENRAKENNTKESI